MYKLFIDGKEGTTGLRIFERISERKEFELMTLPQELRKDPVARAEMINSSDVAMLCLPDAAAIESASLVTNDRVKLIDTSTAHRTLSGWAYGFPELSPEFRRAVQNGKRIAVPGCHAGGFVALAYPLIKMGIVASDYPFVCYSVTGYSGGGKKMIADYESDNRSSEYSSPRQYGLSQSHKHLKEMQFIPGLEFAPVFAPIVADYYSGMVVSAPLHTRLLTKKYGAADIHKAFKEYYAGQKLVNVLDFDPAAVVDGSPSPMIGSNNQSGSDKMEIIVAGNDERVLIASRFDNLGKGASGAAVQCLNLTLGLEETLGLNI